MRYIMGLFTFAWEHISVCIFTPSQHGPMMHCFVDVCYGVRSSLNIYVVIQRATISSGTQNINNISQIANMAYCFCGCFYAVFRTFYYCKMWLSTCNLFNDDLRSISNYFYQCQHEPHNVSPWANPCFPTTRINMRKCLNSGWA